MSLATNVLVFLPDLLTLDISQHPLWNREEFRLWHVTYHNFGDFGKAYPFWEKRKLPPPINPWHPVNPYVFSWIWIGFTKVESDISLHGPRYFGESARTVCPCVVGGFCRGMVAGQQCSVRCSSCALFEQCDAIFLKRNKKRGKCSKREYHSSLYRVQIWINSSASS